MILQIVELKVFTELHCHFVTDHRSTGWKLNVHAVNILKSRNIYPDSSANLVIKSTFLDVKLNIFTFTNFVRCNVNLRVNLGHYQHFRNFNQQVSNMEVNA